MKLGKRAGLALLAAALTVVLAVPGWAEDPKAGIGASGIGRSGIAPSVKGPEVSDPADLGFSADRLQRVTRAFQGYVDSGQLPGAVVLIARNDEVAYFRAFGWRDREKKLPMTTDAIFRIASMTKPLVSVAAMMLAEEAKLDLAAPVSQYLPEFKDVKVAVETTDPATGKTEVTLRPPARPMVVQDLLRHTAGLVYAPPLGTGAVSLMYRDANVSNRDETLADMVTKIARLPLAHDPGEVWEYSMATDVLGRVIEVVSGMDLDRFLEERITKPLGMTSTGFAVAEKDRERVAEPQADPVNGQRPPLFDPRVKPKRFSGGGGAVSTAGDYLRFCRMLMGGGEYEDVRLLAPSTVALMTANALRPGIRYVARYGDLAPMPALGQGFGLGFAVRTDPGHNPLPGSVGSFYWTGAYGTTFYIDPAEKLIVVMMIQVPLSASAPYRRAVHALAYQALTASD